MSRAPRLGAVLLGAVLAACGGAPAPEPLPRPVRAMKVGDPSAFAGRSFPGKAEPTEEVMLSFRVGGPLIERPVDVGSTVAKGDLLARIDPRDFEVALEKARGRLDQAQADLVQLRAGAREETVRALEAKVRAAKATYDLAMTEEQRHRELLEQEVVSQSEYDAKKLRMDLAKEELDAAQEDLERAQVARPEVIQAKEAEIRSLLAAVDHAKNELEYTELRAPFAGEISAMLVENFQTVQPRQSICRLLDTTRVEFTIQVPEVLISYIGQVGDILVSFDALPGVEIPAMVKHVRGEATQRTRTYPVTLIMEQPAGMRILPGMAGSATGRRTTTEGEDGIEVPLSAVLTNAETKQLVWVIDTSADPNVVRAREVTTLRMTSTGIRVAGLEAGTWIAIAGVHTLEEGQSVRVLDAAADGSRP